MFWNLRRILQTRGLVGNYEIVRILIDRFRSPSSFLWYRIVKEHVNGRKCLEIGGPSSIFRSESEIPIYPYLGSWDNVDFTHRTLWSQHVDCGGARVSNGHFTGQQFTADATRLTAIDSGTYDLVLSSHVVEHIANPIRALTEWKRVLKEDGRIIAVVPEGARMFDHARTTTSIDHLLKDFRDGILEDDLGHLPEIFQYHDISMDPAANGWKNFVARSRRNGEVRALHHHVFTPESLAKLLDVAGFAVDLVTRVRPLHILVSGVTSCNRSSERSFG